MLELFNNAHLVKWPLAFCSILALGIILERLVTLAQIRKLEDHAFNQLSDELNTSKESSLASSELDAAPVTMVLRHIMAVRGAGKRVRRESVDISLNMQRLRLRRYLGTLATIGSVAPFIGLFGTVLGVMEAFKAMSQNGLSNEMMATGISEALSATALGLLVAIPSVMAYNYFLGRMQDLHLRVHGHAVRLAVLARFGQERAKEGRQ